ncbi:Homeobox protein caupolican [Dirofilaria immitis]
MVASYVFPHGATSPTTEATLILSSSPSSVAAIEKTKQRQQAAMLDAWLAMHGDNLYPCREEKERLAKDMSMTYIQVNRWFANRRRKQTKRRKTETESPRSLTTVPSLLSSSSAVVATNRHNALTGLLESDQSPNWPSKSPFGSVQIEQKKKPEMVVHTVHSDLHKTDIETLKDELRRNTPSAHITNTTFQQVPDVNRSLASPCSPPDQRRISQSTFDNKLLPTPPAYTSSPLNAAAAAAVAAGNLPAAIAAAAAAQTANPFLLAAALGLQQQQQQQQQNASATLPWISNAQSFGVMLPYLQHLQAQMQQQAQAQVALAQQIAAQQAANLHQQFKTVAAAAAAARTSLISQQPQPQPQTHWLSPPPSVPPQITTIRQTTTACPSPLLLAAGAAGTESASSLLEFTELNNLRSNPEAAQPPSPPASSSSSSYNDEKQQQQQLQQQFLFDEDLMIDSLMEERKDLSEKESIAVAVLAGMAACQR